MRRWFVLRVQSGREKTIKDALWKRIQAEDLTGMLIQLIVPTERVTEIKGGEKRTREQKIFPGYIMAEIELDEEDQIPDPIWFIIRETPGISDFVGTREDREPQKPQPMAPHEVEKMLQRAQSVEAGEPEVKIEFQTGDHVKIKEGPFENFDGVVEEVLPGKGIVRVMVTIFGRQTPVEIEYWQVEAQ